MDDLASVLAAYAPFDSLSREELDRTVTASQVAEFPSGAEIFDGFRHAVTTVSVVLSGQVGLWNTPTPSPAGPDEVLGPGGVFGYSSLLSRELKGPIAIAVGPVRLCQIPESALRPLFSGLSGARFLVDQLAAGRRSRHTATTGEGTVAELIRSVPAQGSSRMSIREAAQEMTRNGQGYIVIPCDDGLVGVLTDRDLRVRVVGQGGDVERSVAEVMSCPALTVRADAPASEALALIVDRGMSCVPVVNAAGGVQGVVVAADFIAAPAGRSMTLRRQVSEAATVAALAEHARRVTYLVSDMVRSRQPSYEITRILSLIVDAVLRRALELVFASHPELDEGAITWLSLGSHGRREPVLSSDVDSAVSLRDDLTADEIVSYTAAFVEIDDVLRGCGMTIDANGAVASMPLFTRTHSQWKDAAQRWLDSPLENKGMILTSLLVDGRPVWGDQGLTAVAEVFATVGDNQGTLRLLLAESLSSKARLRSMRDVLARRGDTFDIKAHALTPLINIARWAALSVGSPELDTRSRLRDGSGSAMLSNDAASMLIEVFDVLQTIRLTYQAEQLERREDPSDVITMRRLSPLDRSLIAQGVREISSVQRRMANVAQYAPVAEWGSE